MSILDDPNPENNNANITNPAPGHTEQAEKTLDNAEFSDADPLVNNPSESVTTSVSPVEATLESPKQPVPNPEPATSNTIVKSQAELITDALMSALGDIGEFSTFKCMFYGPPGSTKSSMLGDIPNNLILDNEDGLISAKTAHIYTGRSIADNIKAYPFKGFDKAVTLINYLAQGFLPQFNVFSVDTVSTMHKKLLEGVLAREHANRSSKSLYKAETEDHTEVNEMLSRFVRALTELPRDIVVLGHSQLVQPKNKPDKIYLDFSEKLTNKLMAMMDLVGYIEMREFTVTGPKGGAPVVVRKPVMRIVSDGMVYAKTRFPIFDANGNPMAEILDPTWPQLKMSWQTAKDSGNFVSPTDLEDQLVD